MISEEIKQRLSKIYGVHEYNYPLLVDRHIKSIMNSTRQNPITRKAESNRPKSYEEFHERATKLSSSIEYIKHYQAKCAEEDNSIYECLEDWLLQELEEFEQTWGVKDYQETKNKY